MTGNTDADGDADAEDDRPEQLRAQKVTVRGKTLRGFEDRTSVKTSEVEIDVADADEVMTIEASAVYVPMYVGPVDVGDEFYINSGAQRWLHVTIREEPRGDGSTATRLSIEMRGPDHDISDEEYIDSLVSKLENIRERRDDPEDLRGAVTDFQADLGWSAEAHGSDVMIDAADAIYSRFDISDEEYNAALCRLLDPREGANSEPASNIKNPAAWAALTLVGELAYPAVGVEPDW